MTYFLRWCGSVTLCDLTRPSAGSWRCGAAATPSSSAKSSHPTSATTLARLTTRSGRQSSPLNSQVRSSTLSCLISCCSKRDEVSGYDAKSSSIKIGLESCLIHGVYTNRMYSHIKYSAVIGGRIQFPIVPYLLRKFSSLGKLSICNRSPNPEIQVEF